jgi:DNA-binding NarL/FixJ family response regulator
MTIRVLLVDDNNLFRQGLRSMIAAHADFDVVGDVRGGKEAVLASLTLNPDLVLMDIVLSGVNGLESVSQVKRRLPGARVMMLTSLRTDDYVREALRVGADGYVLKDATLDELLMAMRWVAQGKKFLSPDVSGHVVHSFLHPETVGTKPSRLEMLTTRERSILQLIAEGRTNRTAAEFLSVSPKTVEKHRANLMHKLGLRNAAELTLVALELGLIERPFAISRLMNNLAGEGRAA